MLKPLAEISPKFYKYSKKNFEASLSLIECAFEIALNFGGLRELGFEREPGSSFNPRVARIPQITAELSKHQSAQLLISSILFSTFLNHGNETVFWETIKSKFCDETADLVKQSKELDQLINSESFGKLDLTAFSNNSIIINVCAFIDRFRHAHLSSQLEINNCIRIYPYLYSIIPHEFTEVGLIYSHWINRASINQAK